MWSCIITLESSFRFRRCGGIVLPLPLVPDTQSIEGRSVKIPLILGEERNGIYLLNSSSSQGLLIFPFLENSDKINFHLGNGEFCEAEMRKIMADERLAEIVVSDPKRAKRILANRQAARSKERKLRYISELEYKVQTLQTEATTLSTQVTNLQKDFNELTSLNNELRLRLQAMEQQAQLRDGVRTGWGSGQSGSPALMAMAPGLTDLFPLIQTSALAGAHSNQLSDISHHRASC